MTKGKEESNAPDSPWEDLVIAILAVNQYSLEKAYACKSGLQAQELTVPGKLTKLADEIQRRLRASGCDRGDFMTHLFAKRLSALGEHIRSVGVEQSSEFLWKVSAQD